ncbi:rRNA maturation RNase YbeY [Allosphingosinicella sp.]|uniref:rRNA maturation RNase YbeY n=1 Tax=Allosphingosinicella sp. TaxID=2823234 RepID=UPI0037831AFD
MIHVDSDVSDDWDSSTDWAALAEGAVRAAAAHSDWPDLADTEVSVKFTSDAEVRGLNAAWRGKDKATNVLSFPMAEAPEGAPMLGDIVLAAGVCAREAAAKNVLMETHATHLVVHGMLHLLGYDHETGDEDAEAMEEIERKALASLGISDPYAITEVEF